MWTIKELQKWLRKMEGEGAVDLEVIVEGSSPFEKVKLEAKEPSGIIAESIYLIS